MKGCFTKLQHLLMGVALVALAGCGANNAGTIASVDNASGAVQANLVWGGQNAKSGARALVATVPVEVTSVQLTVSGTGANGPIPVVKNTVPVSGGSATGSVSGIYPGTVAVSVKALDSTGKTVYEGFALNAVISAGTTTDVGTITMNPPVVKTAEVPCLGCHETALDETGQNIIANYKQSGHYTNTSFVDGNGVGTGCVGCHGPSHNNPDPSANVGARCFECHNINNSNTAMVANHGTYYVANGTACSACHQVHNTAAANPERKSWAASAHGATDYPKMDLSNSCEFRCHNGKTFAAAMGNPDAVTSTIIAKPAPQMITCDACHTNAPLGKLRNLPGAKATAYATYTSSTVGYKFAPYNRLNPNKKQNYPDVAGSNLCVVCHGGTIDGSATSVRMSDPYFATMTSATVTPHNMPAAAVMYVKFGFTNLSTGAAGVPSQAYLNSLTADLDNPTVTGSTTGGFIGSTHRKLGTSAIAADSHFNVSKPAPAALKVNGPCASCHLTGSHSFKIDQAAINTVCSNCHASEGGNSIATEAAFEQFFIEPQKEVFNNALALAATVLNSKVAAYNAANPTATLDVSFRINPSTCGQPMKFVVATAAGTQGTDGSYTKTALKIDVIARALGYSTVKLDLGQQKFVGAVSNLIFFSEDQGAFAHARTYSRRLIYDSIDFLDDGSLNRSTGATAVSFSGQTTVDGFTNPIYNLYKKGSTAYTDGTLTVLGSGTSEAMLYLIAWNRTATTVNGVSYAAGSWGVNQRP